MVPIEFSWVSHGPHGLDILWCYTHNKFFGFQFIFPIGKSPGNVDAMWGMRTTQLPVLFWMDHISCICPECSVGHGLISCACFVW